MATSTAVSNMITKQALTTVLGDKTLLEASPMVTRLKDLGKAILESSDTGNTAASFDRFSEDIYGALNALFQSVR